MASLPYQKIIQDFWVSGHKADRTDNLTEGGIGICANGKQLNRHIGTYLV